MRGKRVITRSRKRACKIISTNDVYLSVCLSVCLSICLEQQPIRTNDLYVSIRCNRPLSLISLFLTHCAYYDASFVKQNIWSALQWVRSTQCVQ